MHIIHVVGCMNRGGLETWLMHVLRQVDRDDYRMDFLVHTEECCAYDDEIRSLGSRVIPCPNTENPLKYAHNFRNAIDEYGPYDILHSHVHYYSGYVLRLARSSGVETPIAHSHTDALESEGLAKRQRRAYVSLMKRMVSRYAEYGLAASKKAAEDLFGPNWVDDPRWRLLYCGIDLEPFEQPVDQRQVRLELDIPEDAFVVGHVGRFSAEKNHIYVIDIASEIMKVAPDVRFLLVGDGPLRPEMERKVENLGLAGKVIFAGIRKDVPRLMLGAMDAFILPSLREGLPLVLIEAQAAGLPCIFSKVISEEADIVQSRVTRLSPYVPASSWVAAIIDLQRMKPDHKDKKAMTVVKNSPFNITTSVEELIRVYEGSD